jgi:hypothetical protein
MGIQRIGYNSTVRDRQTVNAGTETPVSALENAPFASGCAEIATDAAAVNTRTSSSSAHPAPRNPVIHAAVSSATPKNHEAESTQNPRAGRVDSPAGIEQLLEKMNQVRAEQKKTAELNDRLSQNKQALKKLQPRLKEPDGSAVAPPTATRLDKRENKNFKNLTETVQRLKDSIQALESEISKLPCNKRTR